MKRLARLAVVVAVLGISGVVAAQESTDIVPGTMALGFYGGQAGTVTVPTGPATDVDVAFNVPVIGVRYWLANGFGPFKRLGIDAGLGLGFGGASAETKAGGTTTSTELPGWWGFGLHVGAPMILSSFKYVNFEVIPQIAFNRVSGSVPDIAGTATEIGGAITTFGIGARAGFEVYFGFMGIPQLALEATFGLGYNLTSTSTSFKDAANTLNESSSSDWTLSTQNGNRPWDIFNAAGANLAARYYF